MGEEGGGGKGERRYWLVGDNFLRPFLHGFFIFFGNDKSVKYATCITPNVVLGIDDGYDADQQQIICFCGFV